MFSKILTPEVEDFEFDLAGIDLIGFSLHVDEEEGIFISSDTDTYQITKDFLQNDSLTLHQEESTPLILKPEQKEEIKNIFKIFNLHTN